MTLGTHDVQRQEPLSASTNLSNDVVDLLGEMGLNRREVEMYEFLLSSGGATPSAIARQTGQPRGRIYDDVRNLVTKGFARERPTRPILFFPTPLPDVLAAAQARLSRHLRVVRHAQTFDVPGSASGGSHPTPPIRMSDVRVLSGRRAFNAEMTRMLETASRFFWMSGGGRFAERLANLPGLMESIQAAAARGVDVKIIVPRRAAGDRSLGPMEGGSRHLVHQLDSDDVGAVVACATEQASLEMMAQPDDDAPYRGDDVAVQVANPVFAGRLKHRLESMLGPAAGVFTPAVFPWLGPNHGSDIFGDAIKKATGEVQVLGPSEWGTYMRAQWTQDAHAYTAAVQRGVTLRAVATSDAAPPAVLATFQESWNIRVVRQLPMWLTIIDGRELYQAFPHPTLGGVPQFRRSVEVHEIRFYQEIFERLWSSAPPIQASRRPGESLQADASN